MEENRKTRYTLLNLGVTGNPYYKEPKTAFESLYCDTPLAQRVSKCSAERHHFKVSPTLLLPAQMMNEKVISSVLQQKGFSSPAQSQELFEDSIWHLRYIASACNLKRNITEVFFCLLIVTEMTDTEYTKYLGKMTNTLKTIQESGGKKVSIDLDVKDDVVGALSRAIGLSPINNIQVKPL